MTDIVLGLAFRRQRLANHHSRVPESQRGALVESEVLSWIEQVCDALTPLVLTGPGSIIGLPAQGFSVDYRHDLEHVLLPWAILLGFAVVCLVLTALIQKSKDSL